MPGKKKKSILQRKKNQIGQSTAEMQKQLSKQRDKFTHCIGRKENSQKQHTMLRNDTQIKRKNKDLETKCGLSVIISYAYNCQTSGPGGYCTVGGSRVEAEEKEER